MKYFQILLLFFILISCNDDVIDNNTFLPNVGVNFTINLNLSEGNRLINNGFETFENKGVRGVIVFNNGINYTAFDLACPHIPLQECSKMTFEQTDLSLNCPCDDEKFSKIDGSPLNPEITQAARSYIVTLNGNILTVKN